MDEIEQDRKGLLSKTQDEVTVGDQLKMTAVVVAAFVAIPVVVAGVGAAASTWWEMRQERKKQVKTETGTIVETTGQEI
jgi:hypothetical protein